MNKHRHDTPTDSGALDGLQRRIVDALDADATALNRGTEQALNHARRLALETPVPRPWWQGGMRMLTVAGGAVAAAAVVLTITLQIAGGPANNRSTLPPAMPMTEDLDLVMRAEFDLLVEDPEFVAWLNEIPAPHPAPNSDNEEQSG